MDGLAFSVGGYAVSAAYSTVASTITYLPRIRKNSKQPDCAFQDFRHECVASSALRLSIGARSACIGLHARDRAGSAVEVSLSSGGEERRCTIATRM